jgi:hypothetical protein
VVPLPDQAARQERRARSVEDTNRLLDENAPKIMQAMINLAMNAEDERAKAMVGLKLLDRHQPISRGPLVAVNQDNRQVTITSHLGLPLEPVFRQELRASPASLVESDSEKSSPRVIDASSMVARPLPKYRPLPPHTVPEASGQPRSMTPESEDDSPFERAEPGKSRAPDPGVPVAKVRW